MERGMGKLMRGFAGDESVLKTRISPSTYRKILGFASPYTRMLILFVTIIVIEACIQAATPLIFKEIIDSGIMDRDKALIIRYSLLASALAIIGAALSVVQRYLSAKIGEGLIFDMRSRVFAHVQDMPIAFFLRTQTGALISRLNNDIIGAQEAFTQVLSNIVGNLISAMLILAAMFYLSWQLTLVSLLLLPIFILSARIVSRRLNRIIKEGFDINAEMNTMMIERFNVSGALLTKLFGDPGAETDLFRRKAGRVRDIGITQSLYRQAFFTFLMLISSLALAFVYGLGGLLAADGILAVGTLVALSVYINRLYGPLTSLSNIQITVMTALASFERVFEILELKPLIQEKPGARHLKPGPKTIVFKDVGFSYPSADRVSLASLEPISRLDLTSQPVLHDVNFTVKPGQMVALVGPSGAGKTTISQLVPRLYDVSKGNVLIDGIDVRDISFSSLRKSVGMVSQDPHMFHDTIRANLLYAYPEAKDKDIMEALGSAQLLDVIRNLPQGLDTIVGERGYRLSGGEKQRLAIARILLKKPDIVILDEATAHLDSGSEKVVQQALTVALSGRTSIVIAHRLSTILRADKILVVSGGRVAEQGTHAELISHKGIYADLYKMQFR